MAVEALNQKELSDYWFVGVDGRSRQYCLHPNTPILTADLRWVPIGQLSVGEELVGIDEYPQVMGSMKRRKLQKSTIVHTERVARPAYMITTEDGRVTVASGEHPWLVRNSSYATLDWVATSCLRAGDTLMQCVKPWKVDSNYDTGYLAAAFDSEGYVYQKGGGFSLGFGQKEGKVLDKVHTLMKQNGFFPSVVHYAKWGGYKLMLYNLRDIMTFLGKFRPVRLLDKFTFDGKEPTDKDSRVKVTEVVHVPLDLEMVGLQTSTSTFVANGFFTHNSRKQSGELLGNIDEAEDQLRRYYLSSDISYQIVEGIISEQQIARDIRRKAPSVRGNEAQSHLFGYQVDCPSGYTHGAGYSVNFPMLVAWLFRLWEDAGIATYFTSTYVETAKLLVAHYKSSMSAEHGTMQRYIRPRIHLKHHDPFVKALMSLCHCYGVKIGEEKALAMRDAGFRSLLDCSMADEEELMRAAGIGKKLARDLLKAIGRE